MEGPPDAPPAPLPPFRPASARPDSALTACCSDAPAEPTIEQVHRLDWVCGALARPSALGLGAGLGGPAGVKAALLRELAEWPPPPHARRPRPLAFGEIRPDSRPSDDPAADANAAVLAAVEAAEAAADAAAAAAEEAVEEERQRRREEEAMEAMVEDDDGLDDDRRHEHDRHEDEDDGDAGLAEAA